MHKKRGRKIHRGKHEWCWWRDLCSLNSVSGPLVTLSFLHHRSSGPVSNIPLASGITHHPLSLFLSVPWSHPSTRHGAMALTSPAHTERICLFCKEKCSSPWKAGSGRWTNWHPPQKHSLEIHPQRSERSQSQDWVEFFVVVSSYEALGGGFDFRVPLLASGWPSSHGVHTVQREVLLTEGSLLEPWGSSQWRFQGKSSGWAAAWSSTMNLSGLTGQQSFILLMKRQFWAGNALSHTSPGSPTQNFRVHFSKAAHLHNC